MSRCDESINAQAEIQKYECSSDVLSAHNQSCVPSQEVACFAPADYLNASGPVIIEVCVDKKLSISLKGFSGHPVCHWIRGGDPVVTVDRSDSIVLPPLSETDSGEYTLSCETNNGTRSSMTVTLHVAMERPMKPQLMLEKVDVRKTSPYFKCISEGCPKPTIEWSGNHIGTNDPANGGSAGSTISSTKFVTGMMCCATNAEGQECSQLYDYAEGFLSVQLDKSKVVPAQNASSTCLQAGVSYHPVLQRCSWEAPDKTITKCVRDKWVTKHRTVKLCGPLKSGDYKLFLEAGERKETRTLTVCVVDTPKFTSWVNDIDDTLTFKTVSLVPANYTWMMCSSPNGSCETDSSWTEIPDTFRTDSSVVCNKTITSSLRREQASRPHLRFCLTNSVGSWCHNTMYNSPSIKASIGAQHTGHDNLLLLKVGSFLLLLALAVVSVVLMYFVKKKKPQYQPQLQMVQMVGPGDNDYIYINFKDFEYDLKWEFPRENLELGKELGSGAFGMVVQATAHGINKPGVSRQVAVKMLKEKHQTVEKEALMSELKMLTHIGHHSNVVNLLGACTDSGPIYLIFQYCCYGDLLNYLKNNSELYHKSVTDAFNKDRFRSLYHNLQPRKSSRWGPCTVIDRDPKHVPTHLSLQNPDVFESPHDQTEDPQALTFDDLLSFAFQVAKGMEFLSAKNCIHRDLAARNVLVTKGRLVKIGDFGLARDIDNDCNYVVRGNVRLPVKWMAPESIFQGMYTIKSDVWAYGILLWEIFSLGVTPYPGMKVDHTFYSMIERGFKMECPYYADESVYGMMCTCWALDPCDRPSFSNLMSFMCAQLTDREEKLYHNVLDQTSSDYQNTQDILDISALANQDGNKTQAVNDYCGTRAAGESKVEMCDSDTTQAAEEKLLKPSDGE
ncbi:putative receptor-type tyrosine-protein kinase FLT3 [Scophthalmus maximus]|uniref:receptor protein-tyrosine kinase n=1 Tax=Scophthalmus maximus TaxID=52904 RepID=A0A2U9CWZ4_SCOMX|nr:putative receptor-type tyrosine-protein kinase FLT3 [Scophthalmus maximus]